MNVRPGQLMVKVVNREENGLVKRIIMNGGMSNEMFSQPLRLRTPTQRTSLDAYRACEDQPGVQKQSMTPNHSCNRVRPTH